MMKAMIFDEIAIVSVNGKCYRVQFFSMSKDEAKTKLKNTENN